MRRKIIINDKEIIIKPMEENYILAGDMNMKLNTGKPGYCTAIGPIDPRTAKPNRLYQAAHHAVMVKYDNSAILAWDGVDVVGFLDFCPKGLDFAEPSCRKAHEDWRAFYVLGCMLEDDPKKAQLVKRYGVTDVDTDTLAINCVDVIPPLQRKGLGSTLTRYFLDWAKEKGWKKVHINCPEDHWWIPAKPFWVRLGFSVLKEDSNMYPEASNPRGYVMGYELF